MASATPSNPNRYTPTEPGSGDVEALRTYLYEEFMKISAALNTLADGQIERTYAAPNKLVDGMIRFADGATWNPGSGRGLYRYDSTSATWVFLG